MDPLAAVTRTPDESGRSRPLRGLPRRMCGRVKQAGFLELLLVGVVALSAWALLTNFGSLPWKHLLFENADVLYFEHIARDLNDGGNLLDWRLTQAPYLVPDIAGARLLALFHWPIGYVGALYQVLLGIALVAAWAAVLPGPRDAYFCCA